MAGPRRLLQFICSRLNRRPVTDQEPPPGPAGTRPGEPADLYSIELRVHGVSGTPPESLLDRPTVRQVAGDRIAGFYRPSDGAEPRDVPGAKKIAPDQADLYPLLEGYSWGGLTSGARTRALWLALAPFALVNIAPRMLPPGNPRPNRLRRPTTGLIRLLGASLTVTFVLGFWAPMAAVAVRCAPAKTWSPGLPDWLAAVLGRLIPRGAQCPGLPGWFVTVLGEFTPSGRVLIASSAPIVILALLWGVSLRTGRRYGNERESGRDERVRSDDEEMPLARSDLWEGGLSARRLRSLHFQLGVLTSQVAAAACLPNSRLKDAAVVCGGGMAALLMVMAMRRPRLGLTLRTYRYFAWARWGLAALIVVDTVVAGLLPGEKGLGTGDLVKSADGWVRWLFIGQAVLVLLIGLLVLIGWARGAGRRRQLFLGGFAAVVIASAGWMLGVIFAAGVAVLIPVWVAESGLTFTPARMRDILQAHPDWFGDTTRSAGISMLVAVFVLLGLAVQLLARWGLVVLRGGAGEDRAAVRSDYGAPTTAGDPRRAKKIGVMYWLARRVEGVPRGIGFFVLVMWVMIALQGLALCHVWAAGFSQWLLGKSQSAGWVAWGVLLMAGLQVALIALGMAAYRTRAMRRGVGVLWDVVCCWPRDVHPFAPPCYNERVIPELTTRITYHVSPEIPRADGDLVADRLVVAAHSQGTIMSAVVVGQLPDDKRDRVALLTFGCVLDRIYARAFPRYFSPEWFGHLQQKLTPDRWLNLWRQTDYLGGPAPAKWRWPPEPPVEGWPENKLLLDPKFAPPSGDTAYPTPGRHSGYWLDPAFQENVQVLTDRIGRSGGPPPPVG